MRRYDYFEVQRVQSYAELVQHIKQMIEVDHVRRPWQVQLNRLLPSLRQLQEFETMVAQEKDPSLAKTRIVWCLLKVLFDVSVA